MPQLAMSDPPFARGWMPGFDMKRQVPTEPGAKPIDKKWFDDLLMDRRMTQRELAAAIDMDPSSLNLLLQGKRRMTTQKASDIARILGVSIEDVIAHSGGTQTDHRGRVPLIGHIDGNAAMIASDSTQSAISPGALEPGSVAATFLTAGTPIDLMHGWLSFLAPQRGPTLSDIDRTAIVKVRGYDAPMLRLLRRGSSAGLWTLTGIGQDPIYDRVVEWLRVVTLIRPT